MIHTFKISYGLSLADTRTCANRLNERTKAYVGKEYMLNSFLDITKTRGMLSFNLPEYLGILAVTLSKYEERNGGIKFRIKFLIEAEILRTDTDTLDLYFASPEHAREIQTQYAKVIYGLFPEAFNGRPASCLYYTDFADRSSYEEEEFDEIHGGLYSLPYLALASVTRVDFTLDIVRNSPKEAKLYTYMVQQSYYDSWKKTVKKGKNKNKDAIDKNCYDKSFESGTQRFSSYYKYDKMCDPCYDNRPNIAQIREQSRNIARIELQLFNPGRAKVKSFTWLNIPSDAPPLGVLPYLANEQVSFIAVFQEFASHIGNESKLKWYERTVLTTRLNRKVRKNLITNHEKQMMLKISQAISQGRGRHTSNSLTKAIDAFKKDGEIVLHKKRNENNEQVLETFKCSFETYEKYRDLAIKHGIMLVTIPGDRAKELSVLPVLRNYDYGNMGTQLITHMGTCQPSAEAAPELEPVKELYDAVVSFLYGLYDQYAEGHNADMEAAFRYGERIAEGLEE